MAILEIRLVPDPILAKKAHKIKKIDDSIRTLAFDMLETLQYAHGVGLAANQVGVLKRIAVIQTSSEDQPIYIINPEIIETIGEREVEEGCLSIPGYVANIFRSENVKVKAQDLNGKKLKIDATGLLAQALEHEIDHLNGILYLDHLKSHQDLRKIKEESELINQDEKITSNEENS